ncbi:Mn(2+) uptake NRAMP transporter MntH [Paraburkholderia sp. Cy-641]|uniref:Nramp family divalent metal transporter n=1 Tax=Paraburkholderia sp. Cy-641 TaxID=2608337 RepID=UPI00141F7B5A|nr:Nramp family divalent metal transporter [Paraburkholderia sp. Cy-641]NIF77336.1 Mn(2+) uptake NRAMP transporter MntH [Paraburkholderia sp. Cy-641]
MNPTTRGGAVLGTPALPLRQPATGYRSGLRALLGASGPALVASVAYLDPGNIITNLQAGARYGDELLWVVLLASVVAMLFQSLSAKLGIVTGRNLAEICRDSLPRRYVIALWLLCEAAAIATDLAEVIGSSIGISLLFNLSLLNAMLLTVAATYSLLQLETRGYRPLELVIGAFVSVIGMAYLVEVSRMPVNWSSVWAHSIPSRFTDHGALGLAVAIVGATIMPHALFLHSGLTQNRVSAGAVREPRARIRLSNIEVIVALGAAGLINMVMGVIASVAFHNGHAETADIASATRLLTPLFGAFAGTLFLIALVASGISSSVVGTLAGQIIVQGFVGYRIPLWLRRGLTVVPAIVVIASGLDVTTVLIASQIVLSLALPVPMIALVWFTSRRSVMGEHRNHRSVTVLAIAATVLVLVLNGVLLWQAVSG